MSSPTLTSTPTGTPFPAFRPSVSVTLPTTTTLPPLTTLPIYPFVSLPMISTSPKNHLDEILQVDPEEEALRRPKKRRRTKRQRLLELQAQLEQHGDGSPECQQQAEQLLEQLNRPSGRKRRRIASELVDSEKWFCPYECGKFYRKTSTRSIFEHQVECRKKTLAQRQQEKEKETAVIPMIPFNPTLTPLFMQPTFPTFIPTLNIPTATTTTSTITGSTPNINLPSPSIALPKPAPLPASLPTPTLPASTPLPMPTSLPIPTRSQHQHQHQHSPHQLALPTPIQHQPQHSQHQLPLPTPIPLPSAYARNLSNNLSMMRGYPFMPVSPLHLMRPIALTSR